MRAPGIPPERPVHCSDRPGTLGPICNIVGIKTGFKSNVDEKLNFCWVQPSHAITRCDWCGEIFPGL